MLPLFLLAISCIASIELARRLPVFASFSRLGRRCGRASRILGYRRCLEARKERALRRHSAQMLRDSLRSAGLLALLISPLAILLSADRLLDLGILAALMNWGARLALVMIAVAYAFLRFTVIRRLRSG